MCNCLGKIAELRKDMADRVASDSYLFEQLTLLKSEKYIYEKFNLEKALLLMAESDKLPPRFIELIVARINKTQLQIKR